jgi:predicted extracellular nuclease
VNSGKENINYPEILISEVQVAGQGDDKQEFVELYNPNNIVVDLTDWYLQRKTINADSFSTYVSSNLFLNKIIYPKSYFLIARSGSFYANYADILTENPLTEDNSLILKNPNKETADLLGFGRANNFKNSPAESPQPSKTIGRRWDLSNNTEQNIGNNSIDFEIQTPTPKAQNIKFVELIAPPITGGGGGGTESVSYSKILISKILISEILLGENEFIELFNPSSTDISLNSWYLQRKTKTASEYSSYVPKTYFAGKNILANSYFLIARQGSIYENLADIVFDQPLTADNSLILKNPKQEISDKLGFGLASDFETLPAISTETEKSIGRIVLSLAVEQDSDNNATDFEIQTPTPKAQNITFIEPPPVEIIKDTTAPEVIFEVIPAVQTNLSFSINFEISDLLGTVTPSGISSYIFRWKEGENDWQEDAVVEISGVFISAKFAKDFIGEDQKTYYFQVKAKDVEGNEGLWLLTEPVFTKIEIPLIIPPLPELLPIVINEIQTEGETTKDDWVELYNPNDFEVDISNWSIQRSPSSGSIYKKNFETGQKILGHGFFLVVRNDASQSLLSIADMTTSVLQLSDVATIYLVKSHDNISGLDDLNIIDKVGYGNNPFSCEVSPASVPPKNKSISRTLGADTNDNSIDFTILETPTPKSE